jgi:uncharacterized membrane protein
MTYNLHVPVTNFPSSCIVILVVLELVSLLRPKTPLGPARGILLACYALSVTASFFTGYLAADNASQTFKVSDDLVAHHHVYGRWCLLSLIPLLTFGVLRTRAKYNRSVLNAFYHLFLLISFLFVVYASHLGGELIFRHGAGVNVEGGER